MERIPTFGAALVLVAIAAPVLWPQDPPQRPGVIVVGEPTPEFEADALAAMREIERWRGREFLRPVRVSFREPMDGTKLAGWYSPAEKELVVVRKGTERFRRGTLLHELVHALQDQHFDLARLHREAQDGDAALALDALIEGEAMLAVTELLAYDFRSHARIPEEGPLDEERFRKVFLYGGGQDYVRALRDEGGWPAVDATWKVPPVRTASILHPAKGPAKIAGTLDVPAPALGDGERIVGQAVLGEYELHLLLARAPELRPRAAALAATLAGGTRFTVAGGADGQAAPAIVWQLVLENDAAAHTLAEAAGAHARAIGIAGATAAGAVVRLAVTDPPNVSR